MKILAIDPGRITGFARFEDGKLTNVFCEKIDPDAAQYERALLRDRFWLVDVCVIEGQQIYDKLQNKGDPNKLLKLAHLAGVLHGCFLYANKDRPVRVLRPKPHEWKGTIPKKIHHKRLCVQYPGEVFMRANRVPKSYQHNGWDAVGLGAWALKHIEDTKCV